MSSAPPQARPQRGDELELQIDSLAFGGEGVARLGEDPSGEHGGGYVVFVAGAIPGDRVRAVVHKRKRSYAHARTVEVLSPSAERIAPRAAHPGVAWQVIPYERQLEIKQAQVREALERIGRLEGFELEPIVPAVEQWRYRNKLEYSFGNTPGGGLVCGFHAPAGGNEVLAMDDCLLASELGNRARELAADWCAAQGLTAWERGPRGPGRERGQRIGSAPDESLDGVLWTRSDRPAETTQGGDTELVWGEGELPERLAELDLRISAEAFFQTNTEMAEVLYGTVAEYAALQGWERVYDLYCGIGSIALTLAPRAGELWGIELVERAVADAIEGAKRNEIDKARFFAGDARLALPELLERAGRPDVIVVDPPRAGLSKKVVHRIIGASPRRIVYVSCNPTTLAPNAAELVASGWELKRVRPVDMFPQTHHIETVAVLERG